MTQLFIVENSGDDFVTKYDGDVYRFAKGKKVTIGLDAARHIFGFGLPDKAEVFSRHSWVSKSTDMENGHKRLAQFKFTAASAKIVPEDEPALETQERTVPHVSQRKGPKGQGSSPLQPDAGGDNEVSDGTEEESPASTQTQAFGDMTDGIFKA